MKKCAEESAKWRSTVVMLIPARTENSGEARGIVGGATVSNQEFARLILRIFYVCVTNLSASLAIKFAKKPGKEWLAGINVSTFFLCLHNLGAF